MEDADELLVTLSESLRAAITLNTRIALSDEVQAVDLLFMLAKLGASNFQVTMLISEGLEDIVTALSDTQSYTALCGKLLPTLTGAFDVANLTEDNPLVTVSYSTEPFLYGLCFRLYVFVFMFMFLCFILLFRLY